MEAMVLMAAMALMLEGVTAAMVLMGVTAVPLVVVSVADDLVPIFIAYGIATWQLGTFKITLKEAAVNQSYVVGTKKPSNRQSVHVTSDIA